MPRSFKRGQAVTYFEGTIGKRCYFGGKMGCYRVLSSQPNTESGWCIPLSDVDRLVFPAPNEQGSFEKSACEVIQYRANRTFAFSLEYVQIAPTRWAIGHSLRVGDTAHKIAPSIQNTYASFEEAVLFALSPLLHGLTRLAAGAENPFVDVGKITKSLQRHAREAVYHLLNNVPPQLRDDIVMSLLRKTGV